MPAKIQAIEFAVHYNIFNMGTGTQIAYKFKFKEHSARCYDLFTRIVNGYYDFISRRVIQVH